MESYTQNRKILYVDDEASLLSSFVSLLRKQNVQTTVLNDSTRIDTILHDEGPFAVVLSDQRMPVIDGVEVLERVGKLHTDTIRVMVTAYSDHKDTLRAINLGGISRYIAKPWNDDELKKLVEDAISQYNLRMENRFLLEQLDRENAKLTELLDGTVVETVRILGDMVGYVNPEGSGQMDRVRRLGNAVLNALPELSSSERWEIARAFSLFNLGLALLPPVVQVSINKEGLSGGGHSSVVGNHHLLAAGLLKGIPRFDGVARIIELRDKNFDGTGEPVNDPVKGTAIPLGARLLHILVDLDKHISKGVPGRMTMTRMVEQPLKYDVALIRRMLGESAAPTADTTERLLPVTSLQAGMVLVTDVITQTGQLLLRAESTLSDTSINILWQWHKKDPIAEPIRVRHLQ
jgi:response regulator RpfG family c-di-GMP phosphodiesterase